MSAFLIMWRRRGAPKKPVLNRKETAIDQGKQELIKAAFADWIWKDPERRQRSVSSTTKSSTQTVRGSTTAAF
jgi:N12 class adenine-specific DNA methylase